MSATLASQIKMILTGDHSAVSIMKIQPKTAHPHDLTWISEQIFKLPWNLKKRACDEYDRVFREASDKELVDHRKQNAGRREANTRLRKYAAHYARALQGHTERPPAHK